MRVFVIERTFHQTEGWDGAWTSPLECCAPQALVEKRPYIYMGGYDPKVIKNREKLHFFFRLPLFLLSTLANYVLFSCKLCTASLPTCRHFPTSCSHHPAIFTLIFRKISVVFAQTMYFFEISGLRIKISPSLSLKTSVVCPQKSPPHEVQRGLVIVFRGRPSQRCSSASLKTRGIRTRRGSINTLLIAKFRALLYRQPASVPTVPHRAQ